MEKTVNQRVKEVMEAKGWDETTLGNSVGKHRTTINRIINGETNPPRSTVHLIAHALESTYAYLQFGNGPMWMKDLKQKEVIKSPELSLLERALNKLEEQLAQKDEIINKLMTMLVKGEPAENFLLALNGTGTHKKVALRKAA